MNSNDIAWGIIKAALILAGLYYIGSFLLGLLGVTAIIALAYLGDLWKLVLVGIGLALVWALIQPVLGRYFSAHIEPKLNQNNEWWRWISLYASGFCLLMLVLAGSAFVTMTRPMGSADMGILIFTFIGTPTFLYFAVRKSKSDIWSNALDGEVVKRDAIPDLNLWEQTERANQLYCYQCAKKLGAKTWENAGRSYCDACHIKLAGD